MTEPRSVTDLRIENLEEAVGEIKQAVRSIDTSLQTLARLEVHHAETRDSITRAFAEINDHETRMRVLEEDAPTMRMIRTWVLAGVVGVVAMVGTAIVGLVIVTGTPAGNEASDRQPARSTWR